MGVTTTFDVKQEELKNQLTSSIKLIHELLSEDTWGYEDMSDGHIEELSIMRIDLIKMRNKLS